MTNRSTITPAQDEIGDEALENIAGGKINASVPVTATSSGNLAAMTSLVTTMQPLVPSHATAPSLV